MLTTYIVHSTYIQVSTKSELAMTYQVVEKQSYLKYSVAVGVCDKKSIIKFAGYFKHVIKETYMLQCSTL